MNRYEEFFNGDSAPYIAKIKDEEYDRLNAEYSQLLRLIFSRVDKETADLIIKLGEVKEEIENFNDLKCFCLGIENATLINNV